MGNCCLGERKDYELASRLPKFSDQPRIRWKQGKELGRGVYGVVYECLDLDKGCTLAVKHIRLSGVGPKVQRDVLLLDSEIKALSRLSHKNIIKYYHTEVIPDMSGVYIIFEHAAGGSIRDLLRKFPKFSETMVQNYTKQLVSAVEYLHRHKIVHRDIKGANILINHDGVIKLGDFGVAKTVADANFTVSRSLIGSPYWMAPEIARRSGHSFPADIWSVGCTVIEMITGLPPWSNQFADVKCVLEHLSNCNSGPDFPQGISKNCTEFLTDCFQVNPEMRPTVQQLILHPFINTLEGLKENSK